MEAELEVWLQHRRHTRDGSSDLSFSPFMHFLPHPLVVLLHSALSSSVWPLFMIYGNVPPCAMYVIPSFLIL